MKTLRLRRITTLIIAELTCVLIVSHLFNRIEFGQTRTIAALLGSVLRDEFSMSRSYLISQYLEDMHLFGGLRCAKLSRKDQLDQSAFYDSTYRAECDANQMQTIELAGLDGHAWTLKIAAKPDSSVRLIKGVTIASLIFAIFVAFRLIEAGADRVRKRRTAAEEKRRFWEELTEQVSHDVASPLSALQIISRKAPLDEQTRTFMLDAVSRATDIFDSLKQSREAATPISLGFEIDRLVREKMAKTRTFPNVRMEFRDRSIVVPSTGFGRMVSNVLDNAQESGASLIKILVKANEHHLELIFEDDGAPIDPDVLANFGSRGLTRGKTSGRGLGVFQSLTYMESLGGRLSARNTPEKCVVAAFLPSVFT